MVLARGIRVKMAPNVAFLVEETHFTVFVNGDFKAKAVKVSFQISTIF